MISAKLTGRLQKLRKLVPERSFILYTTSTLTLLKDVQSFLKASVERFAHGADRHIDTSVLATFHPRNELDIHLPQLDEFITGIFRRKRQTSISNFLPTTSCLVCSEHELPTDFNSSGEYTYFYLATVEKWVEDHLSSWLERHMSGGTTCEELKKLLKEYFSCANSAYSAVSNVPRSLSIMYLTVIELWVACDRCACKKYPLLHDFDPEVELSSFQSLSLPFKSQLERLFAAETYLQSRRKNARTNAPSLYRKFGLPTSFAVRFFDQSSDHQTLRSEIEQHATERRQQRCQELAEKKQKYYHLMASSDSRSCDYQEVSRWGSSGTTTEHAYWCSKCDMQSQAERLQIDVHEWPLSSNQAVAKATVFELQIPQAYAHWRDATMFLLFEVLGFTHTNTEKPRARYNLSSQDGLSSFRGPQLDQRIGLVSEVKPLTGSHYRIKEGVAFLQENDICVTNALQYQYFDTMNNTFIDVLCSTEQVADTCTYQLPARSSQLQPYLQASAISNDITPNRVIASLSECPSHFSLDEYKAFGSLPIGYRIQYQNILVQLAMPTIDFAKIETQCLLMQTLHRAGPRSNDNRVERAAHGILIDLSFCQVLADKIEASLRIASENWETWRTVATLVQLTLRMISFNICKQTAGRCLELLQEARKISLKWLNHLKERVPKATKDSQRKELSSRLTEIALLCTSTFDTEEDYLRDILCSSSAVSVLIQTSIVVQENKDSTSSEHEYFHRTMLQSWRLLLFRAFPMLVGKISSDALQEGLNQAVVASWARFRATNCWSVLGIPWHHWIQVECDELTIHFNLLTAELLVNGLPLSRLPMQYMAHHMYSSLFDKYPMEVMPTDEPGMEFSAKRPFHPHWRYNLSFGMQASDMLILAIRDGMKFDLVPSRVFKGQLPTIFVDDYFHWYDYDTEEVEFRPRGDPWASTSGLWRLKRCEAGWRLENGHKSLVCPISNTGSAISKILSPLELHSYIHVLFESSSDLFIELPRRRLGFHYTPGESKIYSHQYQGMIIDTDQQLGALYGLATKLILKHERGVEDRLVLIPEGNVAYSTTSTSHVSVSIELDTVRNTHAYQVDELLGRLIDDGSLQSKLFLCYLHALTSQCLPDTLTGHTGTEAGLSILWSAAVSSSDVLTKANIDILKVIAHLTPEREFYPSHLQVMQRVNWNKSLSFMCQHPGFYTAVDRIFSFSKSMGLLQPNDVYIAPPELAFVEPNLLRRDIIRTSNFRVDGFGAEHHTRNFDQNYEVRARVADPQRGRRCFIAAQMMFRNQPTLYSSVDANNLEKSFRYEHLHNATVQGANGQLEPLKLRYDALWLAKPSSFLPTMLCNLHLLLTSSPRHFNRFDLMIWLSTAAFAQSADMNVIQALAAFYNCRDLASIEAPTLARFELADGDSPTLSTIQDLVREYRPYETCPEYHLPRQFHETDRQWEIRKNNDFKVNRSKTAETFARALHNQWPCAVPTIPSIRAAETYLNTTSAMSNVRRMFKTWYNNRCFYQYLGEVSHTLAQQRVVSVETQDNHFVSVPVHSGAVYSSFFYGVNDVFNLKAPVESSACKFTRVEYAVGT